MENILKSYSDYNNRKIDFGEFSFIIFTWAEENKLTKIETYEKLREAGIKIYFIARYINLAGCVYWWGGKPCVYQLVFVIGEFDYIHYESLRYGLDLSNEEHVIGNFNCLNDAGVTKLFDDVSIEQFNEWNNVGL